MLRCTIAFCLILGHAALAQAPVLLDLPHLDKVETRHGTLSTGPLPEPDGSQQGFFWNGQPINGLADAQAHIQVVLPQPQGGPEDWVLVSLASGTRDCDLMFAFIILAAKDARATPPFGTCAKNVFNLRETEDTKVALDMVGFSDGQPFVHVYRFDGTTVDETINPFK